MSNSEIINLVNNKEWDKLIKKLDNINVIIWNNLRLIHYAAIQNDLNLFNKLVEKNVKLNLVNNTAETIAHITASNGYFNMFKKIIDLEPKIIYNKNSFMETPFHLIADNYDIVKYILKYKEIDFNYLFKQKNHKGQTPLLVAINYGNYKTIKLFFNHIDSTWDNPIDNLPLFNMIISKNITTKQKIKLTNYYIKNNGDINIIDNKSNNIFSFILELDNFELFKTFIDLGANIDYMSSISTTHVLREIYTKSLLTDNLEMINYALKSNSKIDFNITDKYLDSFGHFLLLFRIYKNKGSLQIEKKILNKIIDFNYPNIDGNTILHLITMLGWKKYKTILKNKPLDIFSKNHDDLSCIDIISNENLDEFLILVAKNYLYLTEQKINKNSVNKMIKKIQRDKKSIPPTKDLNINLANNFSFAYHTTYEATLKEVLIYNIYLLNKYKNKLTIPIKDSHILNQFNIDLKTTSDINLQKIDIYHPEIIDHIIFWEDENNNYVSDNLLTLLNEKKDGNKNIFIYLSLGTTDTMLHANIIFINVKTKIIERFDPYGNINLDNNQDIDLFLKKVFSQLNDFKYIGTEYMGITSFQTISQENDIHRKKIGDLGGFCLAWCIWYIELKIKNSNLDSEILVKKTIKKMIKNKINFTDFIRNYANHLDKYLRKFLTNAKIKKKNIYNTVYSSTDYNKIKKLIYDHYKNYNK